MDRPERLRGRAIGFHETLMGLGIAIGSLLTMVNRGRESVAIGVYIILLSPRVSIGPNEEALRKGDNLLVVLRVLALALLAALVSGYIETVMVSLLPLYPISFHYPEAQALMLLSAFGLSGTVLQAPLGWITDRWSFRKGRCSAFHSSVSETHSWLQ